MNTLLELEIEAVVFTRDKVSIKTLISNVFVGTEFLYKETIVNEVSLRRHKVKVVVDYFHHDPLDFLLKLRSVLDKTCTQFSIAVNSLVI